MKNGIDGCDGTEISLVLPRGIVRIDEKTARYGPFFAENQFAPTDEFVWVGLVVRKCHCDVTACAEARRLAQRAERSRRRASRAGWKKQEKWYGVASLSLGIMSCLVTMMMLISP